LKEAHTFVSNQYRQKNSKKGSHKTHGSTGKRQDSRTFNKRLFRQALTPSSKRKLAISLYYSIYLI